MTNIRFLIASVFLTLTLNADELAKWIIKPSADGHICEVGSGESEQVAMLSAKAALAKSIKVKVTASSESYQTAQKSSFTTNSVHSANELIKQSKKTDQAMIDGIIYVRVCTQSEEIK